MEPRTEISLAAVGAIFAVSCAFIVMYLGATIVQGILAFLTTMLFAFLYVQLLKKRPPG